MDRVRLKLLGNFELRAGESTPCVVHAGKAPALLAYLALTPGTHPRDKLAALLWPDASPGAARKQLRQTLFVLRKMLYPAASDVLTVTGDAMALSRGAIRSDVTDFEAAIAAGTAASLLEAADLYQGDLLAGWHASAPTTRAATRSMRAG